MTPTRLGWLLLALAAVLAAYAADQLIARYGPVGLAYAAAGLAFGVLLTWVARLIERDRP
jgi:hypothetical protein